MAAKSPDKPAHHEYTDTAVAKAAGPILKASMICGPSGIITMKSMIRVNCVSASSHKRLRSRGGSSKYTACLLPGIFRNAARLMTPVHPTTPTGVSPIP